MVARITAAEARRLGLPPGSAGPPKRVAKRVVRGARYHTQCVMCGEVFNTQAAEDRHLEETKHPRYALVLGFGTPTKVDTDG